MDDPRDTEYDERGPDFIERWARDGFCSPGHLDEDGNLTPSRTLVAEAEFQLSR